MRLGHRRVRQLCELLKPGALTQLQKLQREIANYRGIPYETLFSKGSSVPPSEQGKSPETSASVLRSSERPAVPGPEPKRKYRRHPKPDENAPERPPSAYVIFSNRVREEVKGENLSFTEIAKLVGERWQKLEAEGKEPYEAQAGAAKERYNADLVSYKKTPEYQGYSRYLTDFKAKHGTISEPKRPKLEAEFSSGSISNKSMEVSEAPTRPQHIRIGSMGSSSSSALPGVTAASPGGISPGFVSTTMPGLTGYRFQGASSHGSSPSGSIVPREVPGLGRMSTRSSLSDESMTAPGDVNDPVPRASHLALHTPPLVAPLLPPFPGMDASGRAEAMKRDYQQTIHLPPPASTRFPHASILTTRVNPAAAIHTTGQHLPHPSSLITGSDSGGWRGYSDYRSSEGSTLPRLATTFAPGPAPLPLATTHDKAYLENRAEYRILPPPRPSPPITTDRRFFESLPRPSSRIARQESLRAPDSVGSPTDSSAVRLLGSEGEAITTLAGLASKSGTLSEDSDTTKETDN